VFVIFVLCIVLSVCVILCFFVYSIVLYCIVVPLPQGTYPLELIIIIIIIIIIIMISFAIINVTRQVQCIFVLLLMSLHIQVSANNTMIRIAVLCVRKQ
jgi:hypothetical protein